jgi:hydrogenase maturation factor HypF (carbamoyltransferase family)
MADNFVAKHMRLHITLQGTVQGFGFRPVIYLLAQRLRLSGWVRNAGANLEIEIEGRPDRIDQFVRELAAQRPTAAIVTKEDAISITALESPWFEIRPDFEISGAGTHAASNKTDLLGSDHGQHGYASGPSDRREGDRTLCD